MGQFHWDPVTYLEMMREEVPLYETLQEQVAAACAGREVVYALELGTGTGETARRVLAGHPGARMVGIDDSEEMLGIARELLGEAADLQRGRLEEPLPIAEFDLVFSCLAVHHLDATEKADLFRRVHGALRSGGRFVLGDVIVPDDPADVVTPIDHDEGYDKPDRVDDQLRWLGDAGFDARIAWLDRDLVVLSADR